MYPLYLSFYQVRYGVRVLFGIDLRRWARSKRRQFRCKTNISLHKQRFVIQLTISW